MDLWNVLQAPDQAARHFWAEAQQDRLVLQRCVPCARLIHYPRSLCPHCLGSQFEWVPAAGTGTVHSYTVIRRPLDPRCAADVPYVVALVDLSEGVRMLTRVVDCAPEDVQVGARVAVTFRPLAEELRAPVFTLVNYTAAVPNPQR